MRVVFRAAVGGFFFFLFFFFVFFFVVRVAACVCGSAWVILAMVSFKNQV